MIFLRNEFLNKFLKDSDFKTFQKRKTYFYPNFHATWLFKDRMIPERR